MKDGSMFATLGKYYSRSYFTSHPIVQFDTIYETGEYEIFAVFMSQVYPADSKEFIYYRFSRLILRQNSTTM
jgi:sortase B